VAPAAGAPGRLGHIPDAADGQPAPDGLGPTRPPPDAVGPRA